MSSAPIGLFTYTFHLGKPTSTYNFVICKNLARPFIVGLDFCEHKIGVQWSDTDRRILTHDKRILVLSIENTSSGPDISIWSEKNLHVRTLVILNAKIDQKIERE